MAAGLGFKDFTTGEVLTAADVDGYLMQGIWVFASAAARDAAVTSPQEGNACYLKDTDVIQVYTGSTWAAQSASNPISANIVDAKGDLIVGTAADTVSRLAVGTNGYTLVADSAEATGLKWAAPASGSTFAGCSVYTSSNQTIGNNSVYIPDFPNEDFDTDGYHSNTTNPSRITIPSGKAGTYLIQSQVQIDYNQTGSRSIDIYINGTSMPYQIDMRVKADQSNEQNIAISTIRNLAVGDYVQVAVYQNSGGNLSFNNPSWFAVAYLGA